MGHRQIGSAPAGGDADNTRNAPRTTAASVLEGEPEEPLGDARRKREGLYRTSQRIGGPESSITWQQIGRVLGMSKQAAWEKFGKPDLHPIRSLPPSAEE